MAGPTGPCAQPAQSIARRADDRSRRSPPHAASRERFLLAKVESAGRPLRPSARARAARIVTREDSQTMVMRWMMQSSAPSARGGGARFSTPRRRRIISGFPSARFSVCAPAAPAPRRGGTPEWSNTISTTCKAGPTSDLISIATDVRCAWPLAPGENDAPVRRYVIVDAISAASAPGDRFPGRGADRDARQLAS